MRVEVFEATGPDAVAIVQRKLAEQGESPSFASLHHCVSADPTVLVEGLRDQGTVVLCASSCKGAMTQNALKAEIALFCLYDSDGDYGAALRPFNGHAAGAARQATDEALLDADRPGEVPALVWVSATPGSEEAVLAGIESILGDDVPIIGGSAADDTIEGNWCLRDQGVQTSEGVSVAVLFPSGQVSFAYKNGYTPAGPKGRVTRSLGREVLEIDGRPATEVYHEWTAGAVPVTPSAHMDVRPILSDSTLWPLGRELHHMDGVPSYVLTHPSGATRDGRLQCFANVYEGELLYQMKGSIDWLTARAGRVAGLACAADGIAKEDVLGALMIYCGGCMLRVEERLGEVVKGVQDELGDAPFLGAFTFGEQGQILGSGNRHGNLMISCIIFSD
ncbi:MAG: FIST N-terminal domain-containing protein [Pseudomonadota bacterium]